MPTLASTDGDMNCLNCGMDVPEDVPFCPHCGHNNSAKSRKRRLKFILMDVQDNRRFKHLASAAVITVVIVAVLSVLLALPSEEPEAGTHGLSDYAIIISEAEYVELGGSFQTGDMTAYMQGSTIFFRLSDFAAEGFDEFTWIVRNEFLNKSQTITKYTPDLTWTSMCVGSYTITVSCLSTETEETATYIGLIQYCGDIHTQYSFSHGDITYAVYVDIPFDEYMLYRTANVSVRHDPSPNAGVQFVTENGAVAVLAEKLAEQYQARNPESALDTTDYTGYILSFVQNCFSVGSDTFYHSTSVYWAYPSETLYTGVGNSGDLVVLATSLLRASGFDAGIACVNGHSFVALALDGYTGPSEVPDGYHMLRVGYGGRYYHMCEVDSENIPIGCVRECYGYSGGFTYYGEATGSDSGLAFPQTS